MEEREAFEERLGPALDALFDGARLMVGDPDRAEDLVVAVVVDASRRYGRPEVPIDFHEWIIGRLVRRYLDYAEIGAAEADEAGVTVTPSSVDAPGDDAGAPGRADPRPDRPRLQSLAEDLSALERAAPDRLREVIRRSLRGLPPRERLSVWLIDVLEFSYPQAARVMGLGSGDFRGTLYSARRGLQRLLGPAVRTVLERVVSARPGGGEA